MKIKLKFQKNLNFDKKQIKSIINRTILEAFKNLEINNNLDYEISVFATDNNYIKHLNEKYRKKNKITNVLSFQQDLMIKDNQAKKIILGDIVISLEKVESESIVQSKKFKDHLSHMILHGFMHLLGYKHENEKNAKIMENKEISILSRLSISNPYFEKKKWIHKKLF